MEHQTRQLLRALADDLTQGLLEVLAEEGEAAETELQKRLPRSRQTISRRLEELELWGILSSREYPTAGRGRPTRGWRLIAPTILDFMTSADELVLELLEDRAARHRKAVRGGADDNVRQLRPRGSR